MWPCAVPWTDLRFGVEIEFVRGCPEVLPLLPNWQIDLTEKWYDEDGRESGGELQSFPMLWEQRGQINTMLERVREQGGRANWSCGVHVHVGLEPWGAEIIVPLLEAALVAQDALRALFATPDHRMVYCPPLTPEMVRGYHLHPGREVLCHRGRPQSHRCGINVAAWFDRGTVEIRFPNGSLSYLEMCNTIRLCLKFIAFVGTGGEVEADPQRLARQLDVPTDGYPPAQSPPLWHLERVWLEDALIPALEPTIATQAPGSEVLTIRPVPHGLLVTVEFPDNRQQRLLFRCTQAGWQFETKLDP